MGRIRISPRPGALLVLPMAVALALVGCAEAPAPPPAAVSKTPTVQPSPSPSPSVPEIQTQDASLDSIQILESVAPVRIALPDLGIDMAVEAEGVDVDGQMALPENAADAGWYKFGPGITDAAGATLIAAHIDSRHDGIGPFSKLKDAAVGSVISVTGSDGAVVSYTVREVRSVGKIDAPMAELFDRTGTPRLTLVTCGGVFDSSTGHYLDNVVLTADPVATGPVGG